jgi:uncharacterized protein involved in exopolysaccharide biosynthesis
MRADYVWQGSYQAAILETNDNKLPNRLQAAKAAIDNRLHDLQRDFGGTPEERQAITDALVGLNVLRRELQIRSYETGSGNAERMQ